MQNELILKHFADYIEKELGIVYAEFNYFQLQNRLEEISKLLGKNDIPSLHNESLKNGITGNFKQLLLDMSTNNETSFFRDIKVFNLLEKLISEEALSDKYKINKLNIWSAASSSGQEAISTSIMINEIMTKLTKNINYSILGTDISERILQKAKEGIYSQLEVQRGMPIQTLLKYFKKDDKDRWTVNSNILSNINYRKQNLKDDFNFGVDFDFVLCRNVLIYQSVEGKTEILKRITKCLKPAGYLLLGSGESLLGLSQDYDQLVINDAVIYRKKNKL